MVKVKQPRNAVVATRRRENGFSLLEMMIALVILSIVLGVVVQGIIQMQRRNSAENSKVDTVHRSDGAGRSRRGISVRARQSQ